MALPATDSFNRTNNTTLGSSWTDLVATYDVTANWGITSNKAVSSGWFNNACLAFWNADAFSNDQYSQCVVNGDLSPWGPAVRCSGTHYTNFVCYVVSTGNISNGQLGLFKFTSGYSSGTQIGSYHADVGSGDHTIKLAVSGTTLSCYVNGVLSFTDTDASIASGSAGIFGQTNPTVDDWEGGNVGGAAATSLPIFGSLYRPRFYSKKRTV